MGDAMPARSMLFRFVSFNVAAVTAAPVLPALTTASHVPFFTRSVATLREDSFFLRIAYSGDSCISTISLA